MKKLFYILCLLSSLLSFSQFNIIIEDTARSHLYSSLIIDTNNIILINGSSDSLGNRGISYIKADSLGNIIWKKIYSKQNESWYEGQKQCYLYNNSFYISCFTKQDSIDKAFIMILNNNFDTTTTINLFNDTINRIAFAITKSYNGYIITGQIDSNGVSSYMIKIDTLFNKIWCKKYSGDLLGNKTIETYDSSIISIGYTYIGTAVYKQDWYIVKTDSLGNLDWWKHPGAYNLNDGAAQDIIQTKDSCFVVVGGKAVYNDAASNPKYDGRIMKFDIDGNIIWDKTYRRRYYNNQDSVYCFFNSIVELDDGSFIVVATEEQDLGGVNNHSVLYRLNANGDSLYTKQYCARCAYTNDGQNITGSEYPSTIQKTGNGGFLIGGWGNFVYTFDHSYEQQMFLIKTDSLGCDGTEFSCPLVVMPSLLSANEGGVLVFPNPATNSLNLDLHDLQDFQDNEVFIYDIYGKLVRVIASGAWQSVQADSPRNDVLSIDVSTLPKGIYFIKIGSVTKKFVKM